MMHDSLLGGSFCAQKSHSGYLKIEEGKNKWTEYWVVIRNNQMCLYSDECSDESGEEAMRCIDLTNETRCELVKRRNYHYRFKLLLGANTTPLRLKCASAFHRQQWVSHIMQASAKDRVIELGSSWNSEHEVDGFGNNNNNRHSRTFSTESQISSDADSEFGDFPTVLASASAVHDVVNTPISISNGIREGAENPGTKTECESPINNGRDSPTSVPTDRRGSRGLLRRLSFKASSRLRRNSKSSPRDDSLGFSTSPASTPASPSLATQNGNGTTTTTLTPQSSPLAEQHKQRVFINPAFVPSPNASPKVTRNEPTVQEIDLIDMTDM